MAENGRKHRFIIEDWRILAEMFLEPIPAVITSSSGEPDGPVLLLGVIERDRVLIVEPDGSLATAEIAWLKSDWRYDPQTAVWHDKFGKPVVDENDLDE